MSLWEWVVIGIGYAFIISGLVSVMDKLNHIRGLLDQRKDS